MKLASSFPVPGSPDKVLTLFLDPTVMQACVPGCEDLTQVGDDHYRGTLASEVAHVKFKANFVADITARDIPTDTTQPATVRAVLKGEDRRLGSTVKLDALLTVSLLDEGQGSSTSQVSYEIEMAMWGKLGRLGEAVVRRRTAEVERQFAESLAAICSGQPLPQQRDAAPANFRNARKHDHSVDAAAATAVAEAPPAQVAAGTEHHAPLRREQWAVLALTAAAAFAYGILVGRRGRVAQR